ncbi:C-X-C motif chemokine 9 isoform X1 [Pipistrellus kuhlii]|uniref:C-X-C motif chemokine 9 isoform X1 n=1 Tax=Pipistrellus kuhlii TaxID=59472 RepID=UPI00174F5081|nr:C-X-C motif chemokine 9 isoform X1 [Pipistrellus kuhlii]
MKQSGVSLLLGIIFLTLIGVQGVPIMKKGRCFCINTNQQMIHLKSVKTLKQFSPGPSCEKTEIIAIMKNGTKTCLNPQSTNVKKLMKEWEKQVSEKKEQIFFLRNKLWKTNNLCSSFKGQPKKEAKEREKNIKEAGN